MNRLKLHFAITFDKNDRLTYFFLQMKENLSDLTMKEKKCSTHDRKLPQSGNPLTGTENPQSGLIGCIQQ